MNDDNVVQFPGATFQDLDPDRVLEQAKGRLQHVLILGVPREESDAAEYFASSTADSMIMLWLLESCKYELMRGTND